MIERFETFTVLITKISRSIRKIKTEEMAKFNLKSPHVSCLYYLFKSESLTAKELCDICQEDKAAISRSLVYLEKEGYLTCYSKTQKKYKSPIQLTDKGKKIGKEVVRKVDSFLEDAGLGLSENERNVMYQSLCLICKNLEKMCEKYKGEENG